MTSLTHYPPRGVFKGTNMMTPTVIGYVKVARGWVEFSKGRGIEDEPIFGVTVRDSNGEQLSPDPSKLLHSYTDAINYIEGLR